MIGAVHSQSLDRDNMDKPIREEQAQALWRRTAELQAAADQVERDEE